MKNPLYKTLFSALFMAALLCACKGNVQPDNSLQITENDLIRLDGSFDDNFLDSWDYIILDDQPDAFLATADATFYDDGLYFIFSGKYSNQPQIKVFDSAGHYLNDIGHVGRARNEYIRINNIAIDTYRNEIIVHDNYSNAIKRYNFKGEFLGQTTLALTEMTDGLYGTELLKCLSDGRLLKKGFLHLLPSHEYYMVRPDGTNDAPFRKTEYHLYCDMNPIEYLNHAGDMPTVELTDAYSDYTSDTTYLLRVLDNHIYRIAGNTEECLANLNFIPEIPDKVKYNFDSETDCDKYLGSSIPNYFHDMKDYLHIWFYYDNEYLYEKSTSKVYQMKHDTLHVSVPNLRTENVYGNTIIGCVEHWDIQEKNSQMDSKDYDHRYSPQLEAFYRKIRNCENPVIVRIHYKNKQ